MIGHICPNSWNCTLTRMNFSKCKQYLNKPWLKRKNYHAHSPFTPLTFLLLMASQFWWLLMKNHLFVLSSLTFAFCLIKLRVVFLISDGEESYIPSNERKYPNTHTLKYTIQCPEIDRWLLKDPIHGDISRSLVYFSEFVAARILFSYSYSSDPNLPPRLLSWLMLMQQSCRERQEVL